MLQYQMGSRILTFLQVGLNQQYHFSICTVIVTFSFILFLLSFNVLQKLRIQFVAKRNQKKRRLEEIAEKEKVKKSAKRVKTDGSEGESKSVKNESQEEQKEDEKTTAEVETDVTEKAESTKSEGDEDMEEDPEEDPNEDPEEDEDMVDNTGSTKNEQEAKAKETGNPGVRSEDTEEQEREKPVSKKKENIDKELLQACSFQYIFCNVFIILFT